MHSAAPYRYLRRILHYLRLARQFSSNAATRVCRGAGARGEERNAARAARAHRCMPARAARNETRFLCASRDVAILLSAKRARVTLRHRAFCFRRRTRALCSLLAPARRATRTKTRTHRALARARTHAHHSSGSFRFFCRLILVRTLFCAFVDGYGVIAVPRTVRRYRSWLDVPVHCSLPFCWVDSDVNIPVSWSMPGVYQFLLTEKRRVCEYSPWRRFRRIAWHGIK